METIKNGIYYTKGDMFMMIIDSEEFDSEDRAHFTHVEFWERGQLLQRVEIGRCTDEFLLNLSKNKNWPEIVKKGLLS